MRQKNLPRVVDNPRFLILPWIEIPNLGSHILTIVRRRLPGDWTERYAVRCDGLTHGASYLDGLYLRRPVGKLTVCPAHPLTTKCRRGLGVGFEAAWAPAPTAMIAAAPASSRPRRRRPPSDCFANFELSAGSIRIRASEIALRSSRLVIGFTLPVSIERRNTRTSSAPSLKPCPRDCQLARGNFRRV